ncbi:hypothetical protein BREVNS_2335 [Brevinematales bacterium NS]|nr:hypothetical protein BREVNS_2335 [Brevinematales bacterium NS]
MHIKPTLLVYFIIQTKAEYCQILAKNPFPVYFSGKRFQKIFLISFPFFFLRMVYKSERRPLHECAKVSKSNKK